MHVTNNKISLNQIIFKRIFSNPIVNQVFFGCRKYALELLSFFFSFGNFFLWEKTGKDDQTVKKKLSIMWEWKLWCRVQLTSALAEWNSGTGGPSSLWERSILREFRLRSVTLLREFKWKAFLKSCEVSPKSSPESNILDQEWHSVIREKKKISGNPAPKKCL